MGRSLGIDLGSKRVGIALSDKLNIIASPFKTLFFNNQKDLLRIHYANRNTARVK